MIWKPKLVFIKMIIRKTIIIVSTIIFLCLLFAFVYWIKNMGAKVSYAFEESGGLSNSINEEYLAVFSTNSRNQFQNYFTNLRKDRNAVSSFDYDSIYCIIISKVNLSQNISIRSNIIEEYGRVKASTDQVYFVDNQNDYELEFKTGEINPVTNIYLTFEGSPAKIILKNDSIAYYYLKSDEFSIKYGQDSAIDIYSEPKGSSFFQKNVPKILLFLERKNVLFLILMSVNDENSKLPENLLLNIVS